MSISNVLAQMRSIKSFDSANLIRTTYLPSSQKLFNKSKRVLCLIHLPIHEYLMITAHDIPFNLMIIELIWINVIV